MIAFTRSGMTSPPAREAQCTAPAPCMEVAPNAATRAASRSVEAMLDNGQKAALVILARQAWQRVKLTDEATPDEEVFRRGESVLACGVRISEAQVKHFSAIKRHFLNLAGKAGQAFESAMREGTEAERIALAKLEEECAARGLKLDYPAAIARRQFKCPLHDCTAKQLWCLVFTVRNRRKPPPAQHLNTSPPQPAKLKQRDYTLKPAAKPPAEEGNPF